MNKKVFFDKDFGLESGKFCKKIKIGEKFFDFFNDKRSVLPIFLIFY